MLLQIFFIATSAFAVGQGFPLRNFHRTPWNNFEITNPIFGNCGKQSNPHGLKYKNHEFVKIMNGEAMTSELPNQSCAPELTSADTEKIKLLEAKYLRMADLDKFEYEIKTKDNECTRKRFDYSSVLRDDGLKAQNQIKTDISKVPVNRLQLSPELTSQGKNEKPQLSEEISPNTPLDSIVFGQMFLLLCLTLFLCGNFIFSFVMLLRSEKKGPDPCVC